MYLLYLKKPNKTTPKPTTPSKKLTKQKTLQQTNIMSTTSSQVPSPSKGEDISAPPYRIVVSESIWDFLWVVWCMYRILKNTISSPQSCRASNNKLLPICLFISTKSRYFFHVDWCHVLLEPVQVIPECLSRIYLLHGHHHTLSKVRNTSFTIKTK